jgi:thiamine biosynthesis lipoprotein
MHHVLDPKTGWPAEGACSVTVIAADGAHADVLSKPAFVLGPERGLAWLEEHADLEGVIVVEEADGSLSVRETSGVAAWKTRP